MFDKYNFSSSKNCNNASQTCFIFEHRIVYLVDSEIKTYKKNGCKIVFWPIHVLINIEISVSVHFQRSTCNLNTNRIVIQYTLILRCILLRHDFIGWKWALISIQFEFHYLFFLNVNVRSLSRQISWRTPSQAFCGWYNSSSDWTAIL